MKIEVVTYKDMAHRLSTVKRVLAELSARGISAELVHQSEASTRELQSALGVRALSTHTLRYTAVEADCVVLVDGDIIDSKAVSTLETLGKDLVFIAPQEALPGVPDGTLRALRSQAKLFPYLGGDEEYPRTFGCRHIAETCFNCEWLVAQWKAERRDSEARKAESNE
ncbi:hypothetical protein [Burkholderia ubonensis]|uniref:hypothetical protein n=1 Tax=Burkholderia ubonensis TaxID=101571 RepID=UPI000751BB03|nr:hypothetical protein [Burkholderia ubonensis]KVP17148.1 hypothetical protein WJ84_02390 [Burkholderia ubonensis]